MTTTEIKDNVPIYHAKTQKDWRHWLQKNHATAKAVWLIIYRKESKVPSVYYPEAVDEALCFGWIDSKPNKRDAESFYQFFARRNSKSNWSKINKEKVARLMEAGLMAAAGLEMVELAKKNGTWDALNDVDNLVVPLEMEALFKKSKAAQSNWHNFPKSAKRGILEWILNAKRPDTRLKRITQTVDLAEKNVKANQWRK